MKKKSNFSPLSPNLEFVRLLQTSVLKLFAGANLRYQLSLKYFITLLYSSTDAAPQFFKKLIPYILSYSVSLIVLSPT